ncbi:MULTISPECIES: hypothetical protein [unclassified Saccharicrinis]|uniref:hypothetical protein n=1 Tax=unclassified Saccharicrinis TaxID=2646859 RepID=UPI003D32D052
MKKSYPILFCPYCIDTENHLYEFSRKNLLTFEKKVESIIKEDIEIAVQRLAKLIKQKTGRRMQKKAAPIREAFLMLKDHHQLQDVNILCAKLKERYGIKMMQIHLHFEENGQSAIQRHAHIIFKWIDEKTGRSIKLPPLEMSKLQKFVHSELNNTNQRKTTDRRFKIFSIRNWISP